MQFPVAFVKSVKADVVKRKIRVTFELDLEVLEDAEELAHYAEKDASAVVLQVTPYQPQLALKTEGSAS